MPTVREEEEVLIQPPEDSKLQVEDHLPINQNPELILTDVSPPVKFDPFYSSHVDKSLHHFDLSERDLIDDIELFYPFEKKVS
jgi:hypothetical protein